MNAKTAKLIRKFVLASTTVDGKEPDAKKLRRVTQTTKRHYNETPRTERARIKRVMRAGLVEA